METDAKILVAGHGGLAGSALLRHLETRGYTNIITVSKQELDLRDAQSVVAFFEPQRPDYVCLPAARFGGDQANRKFQANI